jgi:hypothetical protein
MITLADSRALATADASAMTTPTVIASSETAMTTERSAIRDAGPEARVEVAMN